MYSLSALVLNPSQILVYILGEYKILQVQILDFLKYFKLLLLLFKSYPIEWTLL